MGDRVSISFKNGNRESVAMFSHWGGRGFVREAKQYVNQLKKVVEKRNSGVSCPIDRFEPNTVMVDFIRWLTKDKSLIESNLYLGKDQGDGDNSDNGHFVIDLPNKES